MKILLVSNLSPSKQKPYAGIFVINQFRQLDKMLEGDDEISLYAMKRTFTSKLGSLWKYFKAFVKFTPYLFKKYDILHLHYFYPMILVCYLYKIIHPNTQLVTTFHGSDAFVGQGNGMNAKLMRFFAKQIDYCIAVGKDLGKAVEEGLKIPVKAIIPAGIDDTVFYKEKIEKQYDFTFVGSFKKIKGVDLLIEAVKKLDDKAARFCFVGSGDYEEEVSALQANYQVEFLKNLNQDQLRVIYSKSKWYILTSRNEGFGLAATEAMYCGTPVLLSTRGGLKEQVNDGINGFAIEPLTVGNIVETIEKAKRITTPSYNILSKNAEESNRKYALSEVCQEILNIYKDLHCHKK